MDEQSTTPETARELKFDHWCIVELMGHQRIAGRVTEVNLFGSALMRVDVPEVDGAPGFSKFFGAGAIYAITPVEEKIARAMAKSFDQRPVVEWELRRLLPEPEYPADEREREHVTSLEYGTDDDRYLSDEFEFDEEDDSNES
jgi:hypothetical protein